MRNQQFHKMVVTFGVASIGFLRPLANRVVFIYHRDALAVDVVKMLQQHGRRIRRMDFIDQEPAEDEVVQAANDGRLVSWDAK